MIFVKCITNGDGFRKGKIYPVLGNNNGIHIMRKGDYGEPYDFIAQTGGIGEGEFNNFDDSGKPSFVSADVVEIVRCKDCIHRNQYNECVNLYADCESDSYNLEVDDDWFCADGERKEQNERK